MCPGNVWEEFPVYYPGKCLEDFREECMDIRTSLCGYHCASVVNRQTALTSYTILTFSCCKSERQHCRWRPKCRDKEGMICTSPGSQLRVVVVECVGQNGDHLCVTRRCPQPRINNTLLWPCATSPACSHSLDPTAHAQTSNSFFLRFSRSEESISPFKIRYDINS